MIILTLLIILAIVIVYRKLKKPPLYICKDIPCKYEIEYCCASCGQRHWCEAVCDYKGSCDWRVEHE